MDNGYKSIFKKDDPIYFWKSFKSLTLEYKFIGARFDPGMIDYNFIRAKDENYDIDDYSCIFSFNNIPFFAFVGALF